MLEKDVQNWADRMAFIKGSRGGHRPEMNFNIKCPKIFFFFLNSMHLNKTPLLLRYCEKLKKINMYVYIS